MGHRDLRKTIMKNEQEVARLRNIGEEGSSDERSERSKRAKPGGKIAIYAIVQKASSKVV